MPSMWTNETLESGENHLVCMITLLSCVYMYKRMHLLKLIWYNG